MVVTRDEETGAPLPEPEARALEQPRLHGMPMNLLGMQPARYEQPPGYFLPAPEVSRVGMRMPEFTPSDPELWFSIVDRSFQAAGITVDATKFGYALTAIGPRYTIEVRDIIMNPPAERAYDTLKSELIKRLSLSQEHKTRRLLEHEEIGDRKPSQFLRHLRGLAGSAVGDQILRTIWLSRLPAYIQPHLVTRTGDTPEQLADIADAIIEATRAPVFQVAEAARAVTPQGQNASDPASLEAKFEVRLAQMQLTMQREIAEQMAAIRKSIEAIGSERYRGGRDDDRRRPRSRSRSRPRARSGGRDPPASGMCWYHWQFGADARQCRAPCSMQQGNAGAGR
ncbi:uncharacterized protein LOC114939029 [Nylanderia fulva]|uniref:uncharacterized protein LOC114934165 n=1 Tax=Nylanderia fulva TaxID=613905 RepID=UPI0010FAEE89|nr:uncharacterized protein LOC114934165 [Nylanderia fulva]XP_029163420.1 uncharacterized protein LOC114934879 [Nylanderia fulva]XP_029168780.1 uncharacterized protein LOC114938830 [Nylanderia fulva]XP_029169085.1 uncharacterized protein LOC114939029 [Nylanderia fulva]